MFGGEGVELRRDNRMGKLKGGRGELDRWCRVCTGVV
jgi:hypothetical protein